MSYGLQNLIFGTADKFSQTLNPLPLPAWGVVRGVHYLHSTWFWYRRIEVFSNSRHVFPLAQGALIELTLGNSKVVRVMGRVLEFALKVMDCIEDLSSIKQKFQELNLILSGESQVRIKEDWTKWERGSFLTAFHPLGFQEFFKVRAKKMRLITELVVELIKDMIMFSLHVCEAKQAFEGHDFQLLESVVNLNQLFSRQAPLVDELLKSLGAGWTTSDYLKFQAAAPGSSLPANKSEPSSTTTEVKKCVTLRYNEKKERLRLQECKLSEPNFLDMLISERDFDYYFPLQLSPKEIENLFSKST